MYPSVKTLTAALNIDTDRARFIREIMQKTLSSTTALREIDRILGGYGVEHIERGSNAASPAIDYINMGDTYRATILRINGRYRVGCWGDIVERGNYS